MATQSAVDVIPIPVATGGTGLATLTAHAVQVGNGTGTVTQIAVGATGQVLAGATGADPSWVNLPAFNIVDANSTPIALTVNTKYISDNGATKIVYTLPVTASIGQTISIIGGSTGGWQIAQNASQSIVLASQSTTVGVNGSLSSTNHNDSVVITCNVANNGWVITDFSGSLTFV